jgi:hypothetical protein
MLRPDLWAPCENCSHRARCPIKHNVDTLHDDASGPATRERVRRLFEIVHLRRQAHVTMRDLRSALSYMLLRDHGCGDVATLLSRTDAGATEDLARLYYPDAFADRDAEVGIGVGAGPTQARSVVEDRAVDRLVRRLREADVGLPNEPALDRRLDHRPAAAVPWMTFERRSAEAWGMLAVLDKAAPSPSDGIPLSDLLVARRRLIARWRRWAYFERRDDGWRAMVPYRATALLERIVAPQTPEEFQEACHELRDKVVHAISRAEGVESEESRSVSRSSSRRRWRSTSNTRPMRSSSCPKAERARRVYGFHSTSSRCWSSSGMGIVRLRMSCLASSSTC